ncbi:MAG: hypothetical protein IJJ43_01905 [Oscillospiraceae bacterium]|nr:hypothetical protein [Oscillospiraceae bacterium]
MKRTELFGGEELVRLRRKRKSSLLAAALIGGLALLCCVLLCCFVRTGNVKQLALSAISVSTVGGWAALSLLMFPAADAKHELRHAEMLREGPEERVRGTIGFEPGVLRIVGSIRFRTLRVRTEEGERRVKVCASRAAMLPERKELTLCVVNGYLAAFEETEE